MKNIIKLFDPIIGKEEEKAILKTLQSNFWASGAGTGNVGKFENEFKKYTGAKKCIAVNNGTSALHLALSLIDIKNKEIILPSLSFVSTAHAIMYNGGKPVFVDVESDTLCIDPQKIRKAITKKTKAILPVHFAGMPSNIDEIQKICNQNNLFQIEDAAHAAGSCYKNKKIGSHNIAVCFSFHPAKNLAMPTGGAITLNGINAGKNEKILKSRRWCGISNRKDTKYDITQLGWNFYMNEFSAAIGIEQLKKLDLLNNQRKKIAKRYSNEIELEPKMSYNNNCSYHFFWIQVKNRDKFMKKMKESGIETGVHYKPIHEMGFYKTKKHLENTEKIGRHIVSIPTHPNLSNEDVDKIIKNINDFI